MNEEIENYFLEKMDGEERIVFLRKLVSDKEMQAEFSRYKKAEALIALSGSMDSLSDVKRSYRRFMRRMKYHTLYKYALRISAACAAALLLLFLSVHFYRDYSRPDHSLQVSETSLFVPAGQRVSLTLSDGTIIWLNAQSRLTYPTAFVGDKRQVSIEGEAFFEVAEDSGKPFIVTANGVIIKVMGTSFNVYSYAKENVSRVSLLEGSLQVYPETSSGKMIVLQPQEEATVQHQMITTGKIRNNNYFLWKEGIYSFEEEPLGTILKKLELYYDIRIDVKDAAINQWKYTVKFRQRDGIDVILGVLQKVYPLRIEKDEETNTVTINR